MSGNSELIDSIYDVAAILKEIKTIESELDGLKSTISTYSADLKKLYESARGAKSQEDLSKASKELNENMVKGQKVMTEYGEAQKQLDSLTTKLIQTRAKSIVASSNEQKEIDALNKTIKEENEAIKLNAILNDKNAGSLEKATAFNKLLENEKRKLNLETEEGIKRLKEINEQQDKNNELLAQGKNADQKRTATIGEYKNQIGELAEQFKNSELSAGGLAKGVMNVGKQMVIAFITNPILLTIGAIVGVVMTLVKAFQRSEESMGKLKQVTGALSGVFGGFMNALKPVVSFIADTVLKAFEGLGNVAEKATGLVSKGLKLLGFDQAAASVDRMTASVKENAKAGQELAKMQADQIVKERELATIQKKYLKEQEDFRQTRDDINKSYSERQAAVNGLAKSLTDQAAIERKIFDQALYIANERVKIDGATTENLDKVAEAKANIADLEERINGFQSEQLTSSAALNKEAADATKAQSQLTIDAQRRLTDAKINAMMEGEEKQIALSDEAFKRTIEDLKANGQLTAELQENLEKAHGNEIQKIQDDFRKQKADKDQADLDKYIADFEKNTQKEVEALSAGYKDKEQELKRQYSKGKLSKEEYESELLKIQTEAAKEANDKMIVLLQKELETANLSADKKAELSTKIKDLQIANENAVLDATIEANDKKVEADKVAIDKRIEIATKLKDAGLELFTAIADFEKQEAENRLAEIEKQQTASDDYFNKRQENLDKAIMSDVSREMAQKKIDEDKAKRDKEINDKARAEKIRIAKWEKAQAEISATIALATATVGALGAQPWGVWNFVYAGLVAAAGIVSLTKIASQKIPAYATGSDNTPEGWGIYGEVRPEIRETKRGELFYAEKPTMTYFNAGDKVYKSVEEFEKNKTATNQVFEFDYEKFGDQMAEKMPVHNFELNGNGSWSMIDKENNRRTAINRRYKIGN